MSPTFFTADDGDIILRAGPEPGSKHDFHVHKLILSLASPVFKDMFAFPQPLDQTSNEGHQLPIVDVPESPEVVDTILRLIYPGVEPPKIADMPTLTALLLVTDKYDIASVYPILKDTLKTFLREHPFRIYVVACRFGFLEEAKEAARVGNARNIIYGGLSEEARHISSTDLLRWVQLVQGRELKGREMIEQRLDWRRLGEDAECDHGEDGRVFYLLLEKAVADAFAFDPSIGRSDLLAILDDVPDPLPGCKPPPESGAYYRGGGNYDAFDCPLRPMSIRTYLEGLADDLAELNRTMVDKAFRGETGSS